MNKQLKLLAEQAGYTPLPGFDFANELQEVFLAKFAELIVRECANIADIAEPYKSNDLILKHFGIEE